MDDLDRLVDEIAARVRDRLLSGAAPSGAIQSRVDVALPAAERLALQLATPCCATAEECEAREAVRQGAQEVDMVMNIGAMRSRDYALVTEDINRVVAAACPARVKVILETGALTQEEKVIACALAKVAGAAFVKTSTGFGP